jgi:hypothetical protein
MGAAGEGIMRHKGLVGLGFAGSLMLAATLSSPNSIVGPGQAMIPARANMKVGQASGRMKPEDVMGPQQTMGQPTAPNMLEGGREVMVAPEATPSYYVHAQAGDRVNVAQIAGQLRHRGGRFSTVDVNLRDNRSLRTKYDDRDRWK